MCVYIPERIKTSYTSLAVTNLSEIEKFKILHKASQIIFPAFGPWAYDTWKAHNKKYFNGENKIGGIQWGLTPMGGCLGYYSSLDNTIVLHHSLLAPKSNAWNALPKLGERYAADVLLHEMIHQRINQTGGIVDCKGDSSHNNERWISEMKRISKIMGESCECEFVKVRRVNGKVTRDANPGMLTRKQISTWPYVLKNEEYGGDTWNSVTACDV